MKRLVPIAMLGAALAIAAAPSAAVAAPSLTPVPCAKLEALRDLGDDLTSVTNPRTGDTLYYAVIGDAAVSQDVIVMFNGTGGILADWPVQLLTNRKYSPRIVSTIGYRADQDGPISLCHDYRIVVFDYPGVGKSPLTGDISLDRVANDVDAMLDDVTARFNIPTTRVHPLGWSLGTSFATKYAFLSPAARPSRTIGHVVLIATGPGGSQQGVTDSNSAACVATLFSALEETDLSAKLKRHVQGSLTKLIFPYVGQTPQDNGTDSGCTATLDTTTNTVDLSVELRCSRGTVCFSNLVNEVLNRRTSPWSETGGVDDAVYLQQREVAHDRGVCYCA